MKPSALSRETGCDWLSVAIGNIHGAIAAGRKDIKKATARLNLERLEQLDQALRIPLVLHGGSGIQQDNVRAGMKHGIAKINVGTEIRQPYEVAMQAGGSVLKAQAGGLRAHEMGAERIFGRRRDARKAGGIDESPRD